MGDPLNVPLVSTSIGHPVPPAPGHSPKHAITVHLPKWQTLTDFADGKPELLKAITNMYPRLYIQNNITALASHILDFAKADGDGVVLFPTLNAATACRDSALSEKRMEKRLEAGEVHVKGFRIGTTFLYAVFYPREKKPSVMPYWTNAGVGISSRMAEHCNENIDRLEEIDVGATSRDEKGQATDTPAQMEIKDRITHLLDRALRSDRTLTRSDDVFLYQTGMAVIHHVHQTLCSWIKGTTILFGFAFHHTPKLLEEYSHGFQFYGLGTELDELEAFIRSEVHAGRRVQSVFTEFPANPLLATPDLARLRQLADTHGFVLVVDDTIASFSNVDLLGAAGADVLISSLTKSFSGYADVMAGSAVLNPSGPHYDELRSRVRAAYSNDVFAGDAEVLAANSRDYMPRSVVLNRNAESLVDYLTRRAAEPRSPIARIYYPTTQPSRPHYERYMRASTPEFRPGYGCLFSIEFRSVAATQAFNDEIGNYLHVGPHLAAHVTLVFAFVKAVLAKELEKYGPWGIAETQIRVSVGLEEAGLLRTIFGRAVDVAKETMI